MEKTVPKLTKRLDQSQVEEFFSSLKTWDVFTYSQSFSADEVMVLAESFGLGVEYCRPDTRAYREHGCFTFRVVRGN